MRYALPLWYCIDYETQEKLAPMLEDPMSIPPCVWSEWRSGNAGRLPVDIDRNVDYDKFMRQAPSRSRE